MIQELLNQLYYAKFTQATVSEDLAKKLTAPLLMNVPQYWINSPIRILYVGQETLGWNAGNVRTLFDFQQSGESSVSKLLDSYKWFNFAQNECSSSHYRAPFWRMFREIRKVTENEINGQNTTVLWSNLFHFSFNEGSVVKNAGNAIPAIQKINRGILSAEIEIINPTHVVFVTGPSYDFELRQEFPGIVHSKLGENSQRKIATVSHPGLPRFALRTYHPAYSQRSGANTTKIALEHIKTWLDVNNAIV